MMGAEPRSGIRRHPATQINLLAEDETERPSERGERVELGRGYALYVPRGRHGQSDVYHRGCLSKGVHLRDKAERRLLVVELLQHGVNQTRLGAALRLSRQTLHNDRESDREFGVQARARGVSPGQARAGRARRARGVGLGWRGRSAGEVCARRAGHRRAHWCRVVAVPGAA